MELITARLSLVTPDVSQRAALARIESLPEVARTLYYGPQPDNPATDHIGLHTLAIVLRDPGPVAVVGGLALLEGTLTYYLAPDAWGCGYAREAVAAICAEADRRAGGVLAATVMRGNWRSVRVLEANGFDFRGLARSPSSPLAQALLRYARRPGASRAAAPVSALHRQFA